MILFQSSLRVRDTLTGDAFIRMVLEWNKGLKKSADGAVQKTENGMKVGDDSTWLEIIEHPDRDAIAVRYETSESDGSVWDSDFVLDLEQKVLTFSLDRGYDASAAQTGTRFHTPYLLSMLIKEGYLEDDGSLPVSDCASAVRGENAGLLAGIINRTEICDLPVVYLSRNMKGRFAADPARLADKLKGIAHVLVQDSRSTNALLKDMTDGHNEYLGAAGLYYPGKEGGHIRFLYEEKPEPDHMTANRIEAAVFRYGRSKKLHPSQTWPGFVNEILAGRLKNKDAQIGFEKEQKRIAIYKSTVLQKQIPEKENAAYEQAMSDAEDVIRAYETEKDGLQETIDGLLKQIDKLEYENQGLKAKLSGQKNIPVLTMGEEQDFYPGEIKDLVLSTLIQSIKGLTPQTRRYDVISDLIASNDYQGIGEARTQVLKTQLKDFTKVNAKLESTLRDVGFQVYKAGPHYKALYYGDKRYLAVLGNTPSDARAGKNDIATLVGKAF